MVFECQSHYSTLGFVKINEKISQYWLRFLFVFLYWGQTDSLTKLHKKIHFMLKYYTVWYDWKVTEIEVLRKYISAVYKYRRDVQSSKLIFISVHKIFITNTTICLSILFFFECVNKVPLQFSLKGCPWIAKHWDCWFRFVYLIIQQFNVLYLRAGYCTLTFIRNLMYN